LVLPELPGSYVSAMAVAADGETLAVAVRDEGGRAGLYSISLTRPSEGYHLWLSRPDGLKIHSVCWAPGRSDRLALVLRSRRAGAEYVTTLMIAGRGTDPVDRLIIAREKNPVERDGRAVSVAWVEDHVLAYYRHGLPSLEKIGLSEDRPSRFYTLEGPLDRLSIAALHVARPAGGLGFIQYTPDSVNKPQTGPRPEFLRVDLGGKVVDRMALAGGIAGGPLLADHAYVYGAHFEPEFDSIRVFELGANRLLYSVPGMKGRSILSPYAISPDGRRLVCIEVLRDGPKGRGGKRAVVLNVEKT
jgi:hypothetical protein